MELLLSHQQGDLFEFLCHHLIVVAVGRYSNAILMVVPFLITKVVDDSLH